jgi:hypothetical protein
MANKDTNAPHDHPHVGIPVRISKESSFAAPGLDTPAETQRPVRDAGTDQDHPVNKAIRDEDKSLFGPQLGRGGTEKPMQAHVTPNPPPHEVDEGHHDVTALIAKPRGS